MTKVNPTILIPSNPVALDAVVSELTTVISGAKFINSSGNEENYFDKGLLLPLAHLNEKDSKPVVYWKGNDYFPAQPNDNYRAVAFFYQEDPNAANSRNSSTYNLNLVVHYNQELYVRNKGVLIKEYFIEELRVLIRNWLPDEDKSSITVFRETDSVFSRFNLGDEVKFKYPFQAFRINFNVTRDYDCNEILLNLTT